MHWFHSDPAQRQNAACNPACAEASLTQRFARSESGNFAVITALLMPVLVGFTALSVEYGAALLSRGTNQRVADIAAFSGALEYSKGKSEEAMRSSALAAARINGIDPANVRVALVPAPRGDGEAVHVRIATTNTIVLGTILGANSEVLVGAESFAAIGAEGQPACVLALDGSQSGIILSGGTSLSAKNCSVASNATIAVPCGTSITAQTVYYDTQPPSQGCNSIRSPDGGAGKIEKARTEDPLKDNPTVISASGRLDLVAGMQAPSAPAGSPAAPSVTFSYDKTATTQQVAAIGCTLGGTAPQYTVSCTGGTVHIGSITVGGSIKVQFDTGSSGGRTYSFGGRIRVAEGAGMTFPDGNYVVAQGIEVTGGATASFGKGRFQVGPLAANCAWNAGRHSVCVGGGSKLTFGGPSVFEFSAGFYTGDGSSMTLGSGNTNRFDLGAPADGNAINLAGGSTTIMADANGPDDNSTPPKSSFRVKGTINGGGGGSCFIVSAAPNHDIGGSFLASGAVVLGAGVYTVDGVFLLGNNGGGSATCGGSTVSVKAIDVTVVVSGKSALKSGSCANQSFCIAAGYNNVVFKAPTTGATKGLAVVGPTSGRTDGAKLTEGAGNAQISGAFYFPTGPIVMTGGAGLGGGGDTCLQLVGSRIELSGGASAASDCLGEGTGGKRKRVVLVQ